MNRCAILLAVVLTVSGKSTSALARTTIDPNSPQGKQAGQDYRRGFVRPQETQKRAAGTKLGVKRTWTPAVIYSAKRVVG